MNNSDTTVQRYIEDIVLRKIGLKSRRINIDNVQFNFDGFSEDKKEIVEIYAGIEDLKSGQQQKVSQDILKMLLFEKLTNERYKKTFIVIDKNIYEKLLFSKSKTWKNLAFDTFEIILRYVEIDKEDLKLLREAKKRQGEKFKI